MSKNIIDLNFFLNSFKTLIIYRESLLGNDEDKQMSKGGLVWLKINLVKKDYLISILQYIAITD